MYYLCIAYGAFLRGEFKTGQSVVINGATGNLGTASVLVALAMGASKIYAVGRNISVLHELKALDPKRITTVSLPDQMEDYSSVFSLQIGEADLLVDAVGVIDNSALVEAGLSVLRPQGTAVFLGGVISNVPVSYLTTLVKELNIKGSSMYPDSAPRVSACGGSVDSTSTPAPSRWPRFRASARSASFTTGPRDVLMRMEPGCIRASCPG